MTTFIFIKTKLNNTDHQTNINKYRVAAYFTEYQNISKSILLRIIIPKFMIIGQLFNLKMYVEM